ncbi:MAG: pyridine nucleotide-disulfide oxidoreductase, partial [Limnohabitans sp.]
MKPSKILLLLCIAGAVGLFVVLDLGQHLQLQSLQHSQARWAQLYAEQPLTVALVYGLLYVAVTALVIPGAAVMTLAGGAIFGLWKGL